MFDDPALLRYSRHILLDEIGIEGQERIARGRALVLGAGGLGSPASLYLAAAGLGTLHLCDDDRVDLTNLQRQVALATSDVDRLKVDATTERLAALNPLTQVHAHPVRCDASQLADLLPQVDVVLDCSDNFATRHAVNAACFAAAVPLVSGAAIRFDGQLCVFDPRVASSPCYACLFPESHGADETRCADLGVFAPLTGIIGAMQAAEALKLLAGVGEPLTGRLLLLDARSMRWHEVRVPRDPGCAVCAARR
jgi:molybdopterin/thiamine biosynthesis adenylyltransferase